MMPSYRPTVEVDGARATITVRTVDGELVEVQVATEGLVIVEVSK